ncbi:MAG: hypothetical protein WEC12_01880 [Balneolaceae bacterium]
MKKHSGFFSRTWIWFLAAYLLSLALSWCVTAALGRPDLTHKNQKVIVSGSDSDKRSVSYYHFPEGHHAGFYHEREKVCRYANRSD